MGEHIGGLGALALRQTRREHEFVVEKMEFFDLGIVDRKGDEYEIKVAADQLPYQGVCDGFTELQGKVGEAPL